MWNKPIARPGIARVTSYASLTPVSWAEHSAAPKILIVLYDNSIRSESEFSSTLLPQVFPGPLTSIDESDNFTALGI